MNNIPQRDPEKADIGFFSERYTENIIANFQQKLRLVSKHCPT